MEHTRDEHCTVDAETLCCTGCGVYHDPAGCEGCGGHGFHRVDACPVLQREEADTAAIFSTESCAVCGSKAHKGASCQYRFGGPNYDRNSTPDGP